MKKVKCIRSGLCCMLTPCKKGEEGYKGFCKFLILHKDRTTSCKLLNERKVQPKDIDINGGCVLRSMKWLENIHKNLIKIRGMRL